MSTGGVVGVALTGLLGLILAALGIYMMFTGRGSFLIAGYNTMSKDEKEKYDNTRLCKFIGKYIAFVGLLTALLAIVIAYCITHDISAFWFTISYSGFVTGLSIVLVTYCNTGNRFKK